MTVLIRRIFAWIVTAWLLLGCVPESAIRSDLPPDLNALIAAVENEPANMLLRGQLAEAYIDRYNTDPSKRALDEAIAQLHILLEQSPNHVGFNFSLYKLLIARTLVERNDNALRELHAVFNRTPSLRDFGVMPPSMASALLALWKLRIGDDLSIVRGHLRRAAAEVPVHPGPYHLMSELFLKEGRFEMGVVALEQAARIAPDDPKAPLKLYELLYGKLNESGCRTDKGLLKRTLRATKQAVRLKPDDPDIHYTLFKLYLTLGQDQLYLYEVKKMAEHSSDDEGRIVLAEAKRDLGNPDEAIALLEEVPERSDYKASREEALGRAYFMKSDWKAAADHLATSDRADSEPDLYRTIIRSLAEQQSNNPEKAKKLLMDFPGYGLNSTWEKQLRAYHLGKISGDGLLSRAENVCELTEAHFYIGYQQWLSGDIASARTAFRKVMELNYHPFMEFAMARYLLRHELKEE